MNSLRCFAHKVITTGPLTPLAALARLMDQHNVGAVVITEQHKPVGIVTDRDLALALGARGAALEAPASSVMTSPVETLHQDDSVFYCTSRAMQEGRVRRLPIVDDDGWVVGIVTLDDILRVLARELASLVEGIKPEMEVKGLQPREVP